MRAVPRRKWRAARAGERVRQVESTEAGLGDVAGPTRHAVVEAGMGELINAAPYISSKAERLELASMFPGS